MRPPKISTENTGPPQGFSRERMADCIEAIVEKCPRCGKKHSRMRFFLFGVPVKRQWARWGVCVTTGDPVLKDREGRVG